MQHDAIKIFGDEALLPPELAAAFLGLQPATLKRWRSQKVGPEYVTVGERTVRYRFGELRRHGSK